MMRAEPWRKQSLHEGDPVMPASAPKEYEPMANFNWVGERRRVLDILGYESFSEFATLQKTIDWFQMRLDYEDKTGYMISDKVR